jgi:hypothetical protein
MSYIDLPLAMIREFTQAAIAYHPDCYCQFAWVLAERPPLCKHLSQPTKWLEVIVLRSMGEDKQDRYVLSAHAENSPDLLRQLRANLAEARPIHEYGPATSTQAYAIEKALYSSLLPSATRHVAIDKLLSRLPHHEARQMVEELQQAINRRSASALRRKKGEGWIPSAPPTTQELNAWPH